MDTRPRREPVRRVAPRKPGIPYYVVAAWGLATLICGVVLWLDAHFEIVQESILGVALSTFTFTKIVDEFEPVDALDEPPERREDRYDEAVRRGAAARSPDTAVLNLVRRLATAGWLYRLLLCAAPLFGLLGLLLRSVRPWVRHTLMLLGAVLPFVGVAYFGLAVDEVFATWSEDWNDIWGKRPVQNTLPVTWWGRFAWGTFGFAVIVSWVRHPPVQPVRPTDAEVFD